MIKRFLIAALIALAPFGAFAQSVQQSGSITVGQAAYWVSNGVIGRAGTPADGLLTGLGITNNGLSSFCISSARQTAAGRQQMCFGVQTSGASVISVQNYGTATAQDLIFRINGTDVTIPTGGSGFVQFTGTLISGNLPCWSGTGGVLVDCGYNITAGAANKLALWSSGTNLTSLATAASSILLTSAGGVPSFSTTLPTAVQTNITSLGTIGTGVWNGTAITVPFGGTGATSFTAFGVVLSGATTTSALSSLATAQIGYCLLSQGASTLPIWASCSSGTGTAGGSDTQVQFNNATNLAGSANLTWVSPALTIGQNATTTGQLKLANGGALGTTVTVQNLGNTSAYNFNLPVSAGSSGQPMISGAGGSTSMTFGTLQVVGGGTACSAASGNCLDNITNFSSTGYINRQGAGTYAFSTLIPLSSGGTNANITASNGGIFYSTATAGALLSGTATANQHLASGSSGAPSWTTATYPATTTINQILYSSSANTITGLATANSATLVTDSGGIPSLSQTLPSAVQANITATGTIASGTWQGTNIALNKGGTNASLTASNGGIFYSTATAGAILSGTATASLPLLSGSTAAPTWATVSYPTSATSGGVPYFSSTTAMASSGLLGANQIMIGGGAGAAPSTFACATSTTVVHGGTPPTCSQIVAADITTNTVTNANLAQAAAVTLKGNPTASTANVSDFTINGLTNRGSPDATNDRMLIWDSAAGTLKYVTPAAVASSATAGVSSIAGNTGAFTLANGIDNSTNQIQLTAARRTLPTVCEIILTAAGTCNGGEAPANNGTYTTPANALWLEGWACGGGGGGAGSGTTPGAAADGVDTTFSTITAGKGIKAVTNVGGAGGAASGGSINVPGQTGQTTFNIGGAGTNFGGTGGVSAFWGGGGQMQSSGAGGAAATNTGGGGSGGAAGTGLSPGGGGGGAACAHFVINGPSATYSYAVGTGGAAGTAGGSGNVGGAGAAGRILVIAHYGS